MRRGEFIAGLGSAVALPLKAHAQRPAVPLVGYLSGLPDVGPLSAAFRQGLGELGYGEGRTIEILYRSAEGQYSRLPESAAEIREITRATNIVGVHLIVVRARTQNELEGAFATLARQAVGALVVTASSFFIIQNDQIVALAAQHHIPTVFQYRQAALAGGLMSYGADVVDAWRLVGNYAGRILKGDKPADLPVQQATKVDLVINMKTAKAIGLVVPSSLLVRANEVIE